MFMDMFLHMFSVSHFDWRLIIEAGSCLQVQVSSRFFAGNLRSKLHVLLADLETMPIPSKRRVVDRGKMFDRDTEEEYEETEDHLDNVLAHVFVLNHGDGRMASSEVKLISPGVN
jgi:hypothetical protein